MYVCLYVCMYVHVCMYVCTCINVCIYIHVHIHIHNILYTCTVNPSKEDTIGMALFVLYNEVSLSQGLTRGKRMRSSHSCTFVMASRSIVGPQETETLDQGFYCIYMDMYMYIHGIYLYTCIYIYNIFYIYMDIYIYLSIY